MHILVLDQNRANGLAKALQLSGYGLTVEMVPDLEEAARRLSAVTFDAVLYNFSAWDDSQTEKFDAIRSIYPNTGFYAADKLDDFLKRIRKKNPLS